MPFENNEFMTKSVKAIGTIAPKMPAMTTYQGYAKGNINGVNWINSMPDSRPEMTSVNTRFVLALNRRNTNIQVKRPHKDINTFTMETATTATALSFELPVGTGKFVNSVVRSTLPAK